MLLALFYPQFDVPRLGGGMLIAGIAILHVVVAHFAVGAGIFTAIAETFARRRGDTLILRFLRDNSRFIILLPFVFGALSGVGIWFSISLVNPRATSLLIHNYVWGWAIEWVLFAVEIVAGYAYYYTWDTVSPRRHLALGWIYAVAAFLSLVVINGILAFMLTPSDWLILRERGHYDAAFWSGFLNPTYWPSLVMRTLSSLALAGIFVCVLVNCLRSYTRDERKHVINYGAYCLAPIILMAPASIWYFNHVPEQSRLMATGGGAIAMTLFLSFGVVFSLMIGLYAYFGLIRHKLYVSLETSVLLAAMALVTTGSAEFVREGIRKPYVVWGYLWSNNISNRPAEYEAINRDGILTRVPWIVDPAVAVSAPPIDRGQWIFQAQCSQCHTIRGVNGIKPLVAYDRPLIRHSIEHLHALKPFMPPFVGTEREKDDLADYLFSLNHITSNVPHHDHSASAQEDQP